MIEKPRAVLFIDATSSLSLPRSRGVRESWASTISRRAVGKGSQRRPGDAAAYAANYARIFGGGVAAGDADSAEKPIREGTGARAQVSSSDVSTGE